MDIAANETAFFELNISYRVRHNFHYLVMMDALLRKFSAQTLLLMVIQILRHYASTYIQNQLVSGNRFRKLDLMELIPPQTASGGTKINYKPSRFKRFILMEYSNINYIITWWRLVVLFFTLGNGTRWRWSRSTY